jgi:hypothetical protein
VLPLLISSPGHSQVKVLLDSHVFSHYNDSKAYPPFGFLFYLYKTVKGTLFSFSNPQLSVISPAVEKEKNYFYNNENISIVNEHFLTLL